MESFYFDQYQLRSVPPSADFDDQNLVIPLPGGHSSLFGQLLIPEDATSLVVFAHGSGSGRLSPRNQYVASVLNNSKLATLLVDLLTEQEAAEDEQTRKIRFDIDLLSDRLVTITNWILQNPQTRDMKIGYFGASTGAAAAFVASTHFNDNRHGVLKALVSRGGRVDLAGSSPRKLASDISILLLVGSKDAQTISSNQKVIGQLRQVKNKRLVLVRGAGHLFEEQGKLEEVAKHAASWFEQHLNA